MTWVLILFIHVGMWGKTDSVALTSVPGFASQQECQQAGEQAKHLTDGTKKDAAYVCVKQSK